MRLSLSEIIDNTCHIPAENRAAYLQSHRTEALERILQYALDPRAIWLLPKGEIPYQKNVSHDLHTVLYYESKMLYAFVEGGEPNLKPKKRLLLFIELLERLNGKDAELLMRVKDQNLPPEITVEIVNAAFPNLVYVKPKGKPGRKPKEKPVETAPKVKKKPGPKPKAHGTVTEDKKVIDRVKEAPERDVQIVEKEEPKDPHGQDQTP